jgi:formylglycine-generating enzyme
MLLASNLLAADFVELKDVSGKHTIKVEINSVADGKVQVTDEKGKTSEYPLVIFDRDSLIVILNVVAKMKDIQKLNNPTDSNASNTITISIGMKLNLIPAGTFLMGSPEDETGREDDWEHQHQVTISKAFYMQTTEVTQGQWKAVMGTEPWKGKPYVKEGPNNAASYVSWDDAVAYCKKLSEKEGKTYRLPTEAEWEYACRAGTETRWSFGDDEKALGDYAWYRESAWDIDERYAHQVELKKPNAFGLYDMHGNVYEWCHDYCEEDYYKQSPEKDPTGPARGAFRVVRGGSWFGDVARLTRSARRLRLGAGVRYNSYGFRVVRELE